MSLNKLVTTILLAFVGIMFLLYVSPEITTQIETQSANMTGMVKPFFSMAIWLLPVGGMIGIFYGIFRMFKSKG